MFLIFLKGLADTKFRLIPSLFDIMSKENMAIEASNIPLSGLWEPHFELRHLYYGASCVEKNLIRALPSSISRAFIVTGNSIATKTPLVQYLVELLGERYAGTFSEIKQHGRVTEVNQITKILAADPFIDTVISLGGGSPIDSAKTASFRINKEFGRSLTHLTIPTTLSAAECTAAGGYTNEDGIKTGFSAAGMGVAAIFYDPSFAKYTPERLWLATGIRAVDHAVESYYHPYASEMPWKALSYWALTSLFTLLPQVKLFEEGDQDIITRLQLAAFASSGFRGKNFKGGMGLSHSLGYALGSPYGIPRELKSPPFYSEQLLSSLFQTRI